jgi:vancomycin resistance protein VanW
MEKPKRRSSLRMALGVGYYRFKRTIEWYTGGIIFAETRSAAPLRFPVFSHRTPLFRQLSREDMRLQYNKAANLRLAAERLDGLLLLPGETFSYWKTIGKPTRAKGYQEGMILQSGAVTSGTGGGLCQMSNLIYWMALHTPLTVSERYRHSFDVFPDSGRSQPFGSGATCYYNFLDLQIRNETQSVYQLRVRVTDDELTGEWRAESETVVSYHCYESKHWFSRSSWGGHIRNNEIRRKLVDREGKEIGDEYVAENHAIMMYDPSLPAGKETETG